MDQTNLSNGLDAILKAVWNRRSKEADRWGPQAGQPSGGTAGPPLSASRLDLWWRVFWGLLESSSVVYATDKHN